MISLYNLKLSYYLSLDGEGKGGGELLQELKLVIEVNGITHQGDETGVKDKRKTSDLEGAGFKVIRFTDEEVLKNMNGVIERIERVVEEMEMSSPPPAPPPAGTVTTASPQAWDKGVCKITGKTTIPFVKGDLKRIP